MMKKTVGPFISIVLFSLLVSGCLTKETATIDPPELKGVWGSVYFERPSATLGILDPEANDWVETNFEEVSFDISPKDSTYTILKFAADEVYLMNVSPYFDSKPGEPYKFIMKGDTLVSALFPKKFKTDYYKIINLTKDSFILQHIMEGPSIHNDGDSIWYNYDAEMTFKRLK